MDCVGADGSGESVWLGWFLFQHIGIFDTSPTFGARTTARNGGGSMLTSLREDLERDGWDGDRYRRGFFDDGSALGSASNSECRIDFIAQSWAVISRAADRHVPRAPWRRPTNT